MKKRSIGFILFAIAGVNLITLPIALIIYPPYYERIGMPAEVSRMALNLIFVSTIIVVSILVCAGIIVIIKFRKGEIISIKRDTGRETYKMLKEEIISKETGKGRETYKMSKAKKREIYRQLKAHGYSGKEIKQMMGKREKD